MAQETETGPETTDADEIDEDVPEGEDPYLGRSVGSYVITKCLGRGGMGAVYQGDHPTIGSKVAIKFLHRRYAADRAIVERFFNEAKAVNLIGHDNIVKVSDFATLDDGSPYFVMEFLDGYPLSKLTGEAQPLSDLGPIFLQICDALAAAHDKGIIHRDLKPDNIYLVTRNRRANFVKVVDFGIAKLQGKQSAGSKTRTGMVMGTAQYMSPEQAGGEVNRISAASDVYSLGVIFYQMTTGTLPFEGTNFGEILIGHLMRDPKPPREYVPELPEQIEKLILKCLAKKPIDRYQSMGELYEELAAVLDALGLPRDPPAAGSPAKLSSRPPLATPPASQPGSQTAVIRPASSPNGTVVMGGSTKGQTAADERKGGTMVLGGPPPTPTGTQVIGYVPRKKGSPVPWVVGGLALVGVVAGVILKRPAAAPPAPPVAVVEPKPVEVAKAPKVTIVTVPADAQVTVTQGARIQTLPAPATVELVKDVEAVAHVEAVGFQPHDEHFVPTKDMELKWALTPTAVAGAPEAAATPTPAGTAPAGTTAPGATTPAKPKKKASVGDGMVDVDL